MDEKLSSGLLYRRRARDGTLLEPLLDRAAPMSRSTRLTEPSPDYQPWLLKSSKYNWPARDRLHEALPQTRDIEEAQSDFVRDGWSPEPNGRQKMNEVPAQTSSKTLDMSFLEWFPRGEATVSYPNVYGGVECVHGISKGLVEDRSFLLSQAFEGNRLHLEAVGPDTIRPFLQYIYTGAYSLPTSSGESFEDVPTSLLIHVQMYHLADIYDIRDLKSFANVAIIRQCEFGCSSPDQPIDLCPAIEYVYKNLREQAGVIETIIAYCVSCFLTHALADDIDFRRLAFDLRPFHQDLCKVSMERRFDNDDIAQAIIQMPFRPYVPATYASREDRRATQVFDDVYHFHGDNEGPPTKKRSVPEQSLSVEIAGGITLAMRTKSRKLGDYAHDFAAQGNADSEMISKSEEPDISIQHVRQGLNRGCLEKRIAHAISGEDAGMAWLEEDSLFSEPGLFPDKGKPPLRVVNYTDEERSQAMEARRLDLRHKKHVTFGNLVEKDASLTKSTVKEPEVKVSRYMFNNLVSAGLTGKPGPSSTPSSTYLRMRGSSQEVHRMCAELAKEELEKARLEAIDRTVSRAEEFLQPPLKYTKAPDKTEAWRIPPPSLDEPDNRLKQFCEDLHKVDNNARQQLLQAAQLQLSMANGDYSVLDEAPKSSATPAAVSAQPADSDFEIVSGPGPVEEVSSESESDSDLVKVEYSPSMSAQEPQSSIGQAGADVGQASDSEWDMI